jgi:hypothetical protein
VAAAAVFASTNASAANLRVLLQGAPGVAPAVTAALQNKVSGYTDTRAVDAVAAVLDAVAAAAQAAAGDSVVTIEAAAQSAGLEALASAVARYPVPRSTPSADYTAFARSAEFTGAGVKALAAAAAAALLEKADNPLTWTASLPSVAKAAAVNALSSAYSAAARVSQHELPLDGTFGLGQGDPRFTADVPALEALGGAGLSGTILLPANHPTNPFRHRRHPDHSTGYDITRKVRLDFDAAVNTNAVRSVAYGVSVVTGLYREEIFGLHKPLGPTPATAPVGLKTEGRFQLNRVSTIDTLNAQ